MGLCGLLNVDKPAGVTSRHVVDHVQELIGREKVGHAGTLDPLATGVLVVCVGAATRLITRVQQGRKRYVGRFRLGVKSDTDDTDGVVVEAGDWASVTRDSLERWLPEFVGTIQQTPPQVSAVKVAGQRAYKLARRGEAFHLTPRPVDVFSLRLSQFEPPEFELEIECGSGTYVRSIGRDLGERIGCGVVMSALRRTAVGCYALADSVPLDVVNPASLHKLLLPPLTAIAELPQRVLTPEELVRIRQGRPVAWESPPDHVDDPQGEFALVDTKLQMIGIAYADPQLGQLLPRLVLSALH